MYGIQAAELSKRLTYLAEQKIDFEWRYLHMQNTKWLNVEVSIVYDELCDAIAEFKLKYA